MTEFVEEDISSCDAKEILPSIYHLKDERPVKDPVHIYDVNHRSVALIIDNGSYNCRVGWATDAEPRLIFRNCYAKHRKDRGKKVAAETEILIANDISNIEAVRFQVRTPHDENVVTQFDTQQVIFDYTFSHLGINTSSVDHPIVITEAFCNPNYSRRLMSELLFECYRVPTVSYCVDSLLSFHRNCVARQWSGDGLVVSLGHTATHVIPVLHGQADPSRGRRIRMGGQHLSRFLWRFLQLRFPHHLNAITISRAEELVHAHVRVAKDYTNELMKWADVNYYDSFVRQIQLPFIASVPVTVASVEQTRERRKEAAKRLVEMNARKREEKLIEDETELNRLVELAEAVEEFGEEEPEFAQALQEAAVEGLQDLHKKIAILQQKVEKVRLKQQQANLPPEEDDEIESRNKRLCVAEHVVMDASDLEEVKQKWRDIHVRRNIRRNKRQEMAKRRTAASQERMRIISHLARKEKKDDTFGMNDEDWDVYKAINKEGGGSDTEEEEEKLTNLQSILRQHDPTFLGDSDVTKPISMAEKYQIQLASEQIRIGELLFQPSMYGVDQGGIASTVQYILNLFDEETRQRLVNNVFLTGGSAQLAGLQERLQKELMEMRPFQSQFNVFTAQNAILDAWYGARDMSQELTSCAITKEQYEEQGGDRIQHHRAGNQYWPSSSPSELESLPESAVASKETTPIRELNLETNLL